MKLFGRRKRDDQTEMAPLASVEAPAEQQHEPEQDVEIADPLMSQPQLRVLGDEELFGTDGDDITNALDANPPEAARFIPQGEPLSSDNVSAVAPPPSGLRTLRSADPPATSMAGAASDPEPEPERSREFADPEPALARTGSRDRTTAGGETPAILGAQLLIGGEEADLVPLIPDTKPEAESAELDDETSATAAIDALREACDLLVDRVHRMRAMNDGARFISAMIVVAIELDARYAKDWGIVRRNGLEEVLEEVRAIVAEGDRFILESLENRRGGFTDEAFVRDIKTVALKDRPRIIAEYAIFLVFVYRCVLRQYLRPLDDDPSRLREMMTRLDHLLDGVREILIQHVNAHIRG